MVTVLCRVKLTEFSANSFLDFSGNRTWEQQSLIYLLPTLGVGDLRTFSLHHSVLPVKCVSKVWVCNIRTLFFSPSGGA